MNQKDIDRGKDQKSEEGGDQMTNKALTKKRRSIEKGDTFIELFSHVDLISMDRCNLTPQMADGKKICIKNRDF